MYVRENERLWPEVKHHKMSLYCLVEIVTCSLGSILNGFRAENNIIHSLTRLLAHRAAYSMETGWNFPVLNPMLNRSDTLLSLLSECITTSNPEYSATFLFILFLLYIIFVSPLCCHKNFFIDLNVISFFFWHFF